MGENVSGLISWNDGMVFDEVQADLEAEGYEVQPFILPAAGVGAPHKRDRVWFVAHANGSTDLRRTEQDEGAEAQERLQERNGIRKPNEPSGLRGMLPTPRARASKGQPKNGGERFNKPNSQKKRNNLAKLPNSTPNSRRDDGLSRKMAIFVVNELRDEISKTSKENRIENVPEMWQKVQSQEIWEAIRRLYSLESQEVLLQTMQLYQRNPERQIELSPFSKEVSKKPLQILRKYGEFRCTPQGQKLEKQRSEQFGNTLSFLPHEVALAARRFETELAKFEAWHRNESIKAYGNAIVPQVALQIFKAIVKSSNQLNK